jgi:hypothetical protein
MAKLPSSFRLRNRTARSFREQFAAVPAYVQAAVRAACVLFDRDPSHASLRHHKLDDPKKGKHLPQSFSVSPTMEYRAIYMVKDGINVWYWIGTHADYKKFTGGKR